MSLKKVAVIGGGVLVGEFVYQWVRPMLTMIPDSGSGFGVDDVLHAAVVAIAVIAVQSFV